jgi:hypothetical protein
MYTDSTENIRKYIQNTYKENITHNKNSEVRCTAKNQSVNDEEKT